MNSSASDSKVICRRHRGIRRGVLQLTLRPLTYQLLKADAGSKFSEFLHRLESDLGGGHRLAQFCAFECIAIFIDIADQLNLAGPASNKLVNKQTRQQKKQAWKRLLEAGKLFHNKPSDLRLHSLRASCTGTAGEVQVRPIPRAHPGISPHARSVSAKRCRMTAAQGH